MSAATTPAAIGLEVARSMIRGNRRDPRITWEQGPGCEQVKVNSTLALAGSRGPGGVDFRRRSFYAALENGLDGTGWRRAGAARYRLLG